MVNQIIKFNERYDVLKMFDNIEQEDINYLNEVHKIINIFIEHQMKINKEYTITDIDNIIGKDIVALETPKNLKLKSGLIRSFYMCQSDVIKWINCGCGNTGKFKKCL